MVRFNRGAKIMLVEKSDDNFSQIESDYMGSSMIGVLLIKDGGEKWITPESDYSEESICDALAMYP